MQEEIGTARRMVHVSRDALTSELLWAAAVRRQLPGVGGARAAERPLCALRHRRRHIVSWICQLVGARRRRARVRGSSAPTFADSLAVWFCVSPGETALLFHRPAYEAPTKKMLKYCDDELDPKSRTLLDYHPVEVARQNGAGGVR
jgi:hypothetical protein